MDDQQELILSETSECPTREQTDPSDSILANIPNPKSLLGVRMGEATKVPTQIPSKVSSDASGIASEEGSQLEDSAASGPIPSVNELQSDEGLTGHPSTVTGQFAPMRWIRLLSVAAVLGLALLASALAGFLAGRNSGAASASNEQKLTLEQMGRSLKDKDERLLALMTEAQSKAQEFKRTLDDAESKRRMNEEDLIVKLDEALKNAEAFKRLAEGREIKLEEAQHELEKVTAFTSTSPEYTFSLPPDPPKIATPAATVLLKNSDSSQSKRYTLGAKKRSPPSVGQADN